MAPRSPRIWLLDIRTEIRDIRAAITGIGLEDFATSWVTRRAVEHGLLIVAEAAKHVPGVMKDRHPDVPWQKIHGLGNMLRHEYRRVDPAILWSVVTEHLDRLDDAARTLLEGLDEF